MKRSLLLAGTFGTLITTGMLVNLVGENTDGAIGTGAPTINTSGVSAASPNDSASDVELPSLDLADGRIELTNRRIAEFGVWSVNMGSQRFDEPGSQQARDDFGRRLRVLANAMKVRRAQGWSTNLIALQEASVGDDHGISCPDGTRSHAAVCLARLLQQQTGQRYVGRANAYLGVVYNQDVFSLREEPTTINGATSGYEALKNGGFYATRVHHNASGVSFRFLSVHLAVTGGNHHPIANREFESEYHMDSLWLINRFLTEHHASGDANAIVAGDFNHSFSSDWNRHVPFSVVTAPPNEQDAIDLAMFGPRELPGVSKDFKVSPINGEIGYFLEVDFPPGSCSAWAANENLVEYAYSDHCAMATKWQIQKKQAPPLCSGETCCPAGQRRCPCNGECMKASLCNKACD